MSTVPSPRRTTAPRAALPFANGDRMSQPEFHRLYETCPPGVKAELIGGVVYIASAGWPALPFANGDHMSQPEFHRRYLKCPPEVKAELIGGVVYMASPLGEPHGSNHQELNGPCWLYKANTPGVQVLDNATTILGESSEPQPDVALRILPEWGGQSRTSPEQYVTGPPELLAEVADSTRAIALHRKRADYEQAGVIEYLVLCLREQEVHWFDFPAGGELEPTRGGVYRSRVFPGLWIDAAAIFAGDSLKSLKVIRRGLASKEHAAFVKQLKAAHRKLTRGR